MTIAVSGSSVDGCKLHVMKDADAGEVEALQMADAEDDEARHDTVADERSDRSD
jgi:hypothetical protein